MHRRILRRLLVAAGAALLLTPAVATAGTASVPEGRLPDPEHLRTLGLRVTWPLARASSTVAPHTTLRVRVRSTSRRAKPVTVTFARMRPQRRTIVRSRLRSGVVTVAVPAAAGALYSLSLTAGKRTYRSWVTTPAIPAPQPSEPEPPVMAAPLPPRQCGYATSPRSATVTLDATTVEASGSVRYTMRNTGETCLRTGGEGVLERLVDGQWVLSPHGHVMAPPGFGLVPGGTLEHYVSLFGNAPSGRYRATVPAQVLLDFSALAIGEASGSAEFDVVPSSSPSE